MVESAGRYLDQPEGAVDGAGWSTFLGLLKSRRRARPLNGVVVTLCVDTLLRSSEHDLELHARHVRTRLQDIQQTLHVDVPVYLVLTQADRLAAMKLDASHLVHMPSHTFFWVGRYAERAEGSLRLLRLMLRQCCSSQHCQ